MPVTPKIPSDISFQAAIEATQQLLAAVALSAPDAGPNLEKDAAEIPQAIAALLQQQSGARGFFVAYLTGDHAVADPPHPAIVAGLRQAPQQSADMLTKNLAMSTAMALVHRRQNNEDMAAQSLQVRSRTMDLIAALALPELAQALAQLRDAAGYNGMEDEADSTAYTPFLARWNYDAEQRQQIHKATLAALALRPAG